MVLNYFNINYLNIIYTLRSIRLVTMNQFIYLYFRKLFGNLKIFGYALFYTLVFLCILSAITLQLFCGINTVYGIPFLTDFLHAFRIHFSIFVQDTAYDEIYTLAVEASTSLSYFIIIYFTACHLLTATIMLSIVIAVILSNLQLTEKEIQKYQKVFTVTFPTLENNFDYYLTDKEMTLDLTLDSIVKESDLIPVSIRIYKYI